VCVWEWGRADTALEGYRLCLFTFEGRPFLLSLYRARAGRVVSAVKERYLNYEMKPSIQAVNKYRNRT
jgi:hypothetical protein